MATFTISGELGSAADWATVVVAAGSAFIAVVSVAITLLGAIAVAYLGWQANRQVGHIDATDRRIKQRESDLLMILFEGELGVLSISVGRLITFLEKCEKTYDQDPEVRAKAAEIINALAIPEIDANFARLHVMPDEFCYSIARLKGLLSMMRTTADAGKNSVRSQLDGFESAIDKTARGIVKEAERLQAVAKAKRVALVPKEA